MLRIGIIGNSGKVNQAAIEYVRTQPDLVISGIFVREEKTNQDSSYPLFSNIKHLADSCDAIIDFSSIELSLKLIEELSLYDIVYVCGTTGFSTEQLDKIANCQINLRLIYSANMSIGINLIDIMLKQMVNQLGRDFDYAIVETHRKHKKDHPSGTSKMLAKTIEQANSKAKVDIASLRLADNPAEHQVIFSNLDEYISISHRALNRSLYASGAILACRWGQDKKSGYYSMQDVLKINV